MELLLKRIYKGNKYTIGKLYIDGEWFCDTIEDVVRSLPKNCPHTPKGRNCECKEKVYGETAIPAGIYKVILSYSNRFKRILPELLNVPHFLGIRIHRGNTEQDSAGCIILGENKVKGKVINSTPYEIKLVKLLENQKNITMTII